MDRLRALASQFHQGLGCSLDGRRTGVGIGVSLQHFGDETDLLWMERPAGCTFVSG